MDIKITKLGHTEKPPIELLLQADPSEEMIQKYLYAGDCYLAKSGDEVVGAFVMMPATEEEMELKNISVADKHQNQGVGKEILKYVIRISKLEGFQYLIVKTADTSKDQIHFYEKMGFENYFIVKSHFIKYYEHPIVENGKQAVDQVALRKKL